MDYETLIEEIIKRVLKRLEEKAAWKLENKKVITEQDVITAWKHHITEIRLEKGQLITELARDSAKIRGIEIRGDRF